MGEKKLKIKKKIITITIIIIVITSRPHVIAVTNLNELGRRISKSISIYN